VIFGKKASSEKIKLLFQKVPKLRETSIISLSNKKDIKNDNFARELCSKSQSKND